MAPKSVGNIIQELMQRVPPNQMAKMQHFSAISTAYRRAVDKYPEHLPKIDWDYYRQNVLPEMQNWVNEFEKKYAELNKTFDDRINLDLSCYYKELEEQRCQVEKEIEEFKAQSCQRIKCLEQEIERIKATIPYTEMTMEEFVECCPEHAEMVPSYGKELFWPFLPEEQKPGPQMVVHHHDEDTEAPADKKEEAAAAQANAAEQPKEAAESKEDNQEKAKDKDDPAKDPKKPGDNDKK